MFRPTKINPRWLALPAIVSLFSLLAFAAIPTGDPRWLAWLGNLAFLGFLGFLAPDRARRSGA